MGLNRIREILLGALFALSSSHGWAHDLYSTELPDGNELCVELSEDGSRDRIYLRREGARNKTIVRGQLTGLHFPDPHIQSILDERIAWLGLSEKDGADFRFYPEDSNVEHLVVITPWNKPFVMNFEENRAERSRVIKYGKSEYVVISFGDPSPLNGPGRTFLVDLTAQRAHLIDDWAHPVDTLGTVVSAHGKVKIRGISQEFNLRNFDSIVDKTLPRYDFNYLEENPRAGDLNIFGHPLWERFSNSGLNEYSLYRNDGGFANYRRMLKSFSKAIASAPESEESEAAQAAIRLVLGGEAVIRRKLQIADEAPLKSADYLRVVELAVRPSRHELESERVRVGRLFQTHVGKQVRATPTRQARYRTLADFLQGENEEYRQEAKQILEVLLGGTVGVARAAGLPPMQSLSAPDYVRAAVAKAENRERLIRQIKLQEVLAANRAENRGDWSLLAKVLAKSTHAEWRQAASDEILARLAGRVPRATDEAVLDEADPDTFIRIAQQFAARRAEPKNAKCPLWLLR